MKAEELKELRKVMSLTQKQMGEFLTVGERTIRRWENGEQKVPAWAERIINISGI